MSTRLPDGYVARLAHDTRLCERTLLGGSTGVVLRLKPRAVTLLQDRSVVVRDRDSAALARVLLDRGLADPAWPAPTDPARADVEAGREVTVVVPVRDRPVALARLLDALPAGVPVVVVDDGSRDPGAVAAVAHRRGARIVVHPENRGPAAARNTGLAASSTELVAFVDSDVVPVAGWLAALVRHFEDPATAVVAPRVRGLEQGGGSWVERYEAARSSLDLGPHPAAVQPHGRVAYLPSAAVLVRRDAFPGFEESLRVAEDVDAVWRTVAAGWRVRYEPTALVGHDHRTRPDAWLRRKAFYGSGAALLAERHGTAAAPAVLTPWTAVLSVALLAQRRWSAPVALGAWGVSTAVTARRLRGGGAPVRTAATATAIGTVATLHQTASGLVRHYWPLSLPLALVSHRARRAVLVAAVAEGLLDHRRTRPDLDPVRYVVARRLDDLAYGAGLWTGVVRARSAAALLPRWRGRRTPPPAAAPTPVTTSRKGNAHGQERLVRDGR